MTGDPQGSGVGVSRGSIIEAARAGSARVVGVTAPAGYGKSILLAQWAGAEHRVVAIVRLDRSDDDVDRFLDVLATAFFNAVRTPESSRTTTAPGAWVVGAHRLAAAMSACRRPFVLFIDDVHVLRSPSCQEVLRMVVAAVPSGSQVVTASRHSQPHLSRLRAGGDAAELTSDQLAFGMREARAVFAKAGVELDRAEAERVVVATEGWPVGIALAARAGLPSPSAVRGDDRHIADYFEAEVLAPLTPALRAFLRRSAVLDRLGGGVCDAVLARRDSAARLREVESSVLFVAPVGPGRSWYRHHRLFREFLLADLRREDTDVVRGLHGRAAGWFESAGAPEVAVEHLLTTDEHDWTARLVGSTAPRAWQAGEVATVERWLATLGDDQIAAHPRLAVVQGWVATLTGRPAVAERWLAHLDGESTLETALAPEVAMLRSAMCPGGPDRALRDARFAVESLDRWSGRRMVARALCGEAHLLLGESDEAVESLERAARQAQQERRHDVAMSALATLAWISMDRGAWDEGADHVRGCLAALEALRPAPHPSTLLAHAASARGHLRRGDSSAAVRDLASAVATRGVSTYARPFPAVKGRLETAKLLWATGDHAGARALVRELHDIVLERPDVGVLRGEFDGFIEMMQGGPEPGRDTVTAPLTPAELRVLPYLQTHLTIAQIGERLFVSRNTANSEIASIYRKLGVSSRGDAVVRATVLGLLSQ
ncbi:LuxR family transcriptional regulator [Aeromicrobium choanae]|uniref:LuxR family transcriptional regulator, maltose regulon positive regulatory protein n=1 Tax=Aeromicrobium choanae TaxID=1736691 RepID=A0A1T4Z8Q4_9ACTN|nr:LuxR family transcriptional regulator [Aeromicrobium choanae]SKB10243.1 LuxR family transcriptional regulator, maltose regulon positive regulatory protein [Aeromicrobium choanae]